MVEKKDQPDLDAAYALETPEDNVRLYADWADTYDSGFAVQMDYILPQQVAGVFARSYVGKGPVLDVGAGTGLVAEALRPGLVIDALDISAEMLAVARGKGLYRDCIEGDLTVGLDLAAGSYDAVISSGTFTHGHLGPDAIDPLLEVAAPGALFVLSVNDAHYEAQGFAAKVAALGGRITGVRHEIVDIYGAGADPAHAQDKARVLVFRVRPAD